MKHIPLFSIAALLLFSACKQQAGKNTAEPADTLSAAPVKALLADPPLVSGSITLSEEDFGPLIELEGRRYDAAPECRRNLHREAHKKRRRSIVGIFPLV